MITPVAEQFIPHAETRSQGLDIPRGYCSYMDSLEPDFLGAGGASWAYRLGNGQVLKMNYLHLQETVEFATLNGMSIEEADTWLLPHLRDDVVNIQKRAANYRRHFGAHVVPEEFTMQRVSLPGFLLHKTTEMAAAHTHVDPDQTYAVHTLLRFQDYVDIHRPDTLTLSTRYAERRNSLDQQAYGEVTAWLLNDVSYHAGRFAMLLNIQRSPWLTTFTSELLRSPTLQRATRNFLRLSADWMYEHGEPPDYIGVNNVFFVKRTRPSTINEWDFFMIDGLYEESSKPWRWACAIMQRVAGGGVLHQSQVKYIMPMLNIMRVHNALAMVSNAPELAIRVPWSGDASFWRNVLAMVHTHCPARFISYPSGAVGACNTWTC